MLSLSSAFVAKLVVSPQPCPSCTSPFTPDLRTILCPRPNVLIFLHSDVLVPFFYGRPLPSLVKRPMAGGAIPRAAALLANHTYELRPRTRRTPQVPDDVPILAVAEAMSKLDISTTASTSDSSKKAAAKQRSREVFQYEHFIYDENDKFLGTGAAMRSTTYEGRPVPNGYVLLVFLYVACEDYIYPHQNVFPVPCSGPEQRVTLKDTTGWTVIWDQSCVGTLVHREEAMIEVLYGPA
mgnify:CR=1 FL=1